MSTEVEGAPARPFAAVGWSAWILVAATAGLFVAAGGLLWWRQGAGVFGQVMTSALAWCF